ncbi:MAG: hypothetical protein ACLT4Y_09655 [Bifidobacterium breve]
MAATSADIKTKTASYGGSSTTTSFIGCIPFALLVLLMLFCMFMATAQAFAEAVVGA